MRSLCLSHSLSGMVISSRFLAFAALLVSVRCQICHTFIPGFPNTKWTSSLESPGSSCATYHRIGSPRAKRHALFYSRCGWLRRQNSWQGSDSNSGRKDEAALRGYWTDFYGSRHTQRTEFTLNISSRLVDTSRRCVDSVPNGGRLSGSLILTLNGRTNRHWQAAFICFSAALEGLLTYDRAPGITRRLATSNACLTKRTVRGRDAAYRAFKHSYNIRSDIAHGRVASMRSPRRNLHELAQVSRLLRILWGRVLSSTHIESELEGSDTRRATFFRNLEPEYSPPA